MFQALATMAPQIDAAYERLADYGVDPTPEAVRVLFAAIAAADSFDPDAGAIRGNVGKSLNAYVSACATYRRTAAIDGQTEPTTDTGVPIDLSSTGDWDGHAFHAYVTTAQAWSATEHAVKRERGKKGTSVKVVRRGAAYVIGSTAGTSGDDHGMLDGCDTLVHHYGRRMAHGWDAIGIAKMTSAMFPEIPAMIGSEAVAWSEIVPADVSSTDVHGVAVHSADATGYLTCTSAIVDAVTGPARGGSRKVVAWPTRNTIRKARARTNDPEGNDVELVAPASDLEHVWVGHTLVKRPPVKHARTARAARTVGAYRADTLSHALAALEGRTVEPGQRVTVSGDTWSLTVRRSAAAKRAWHARVKRDGAEPVEVRNGASLGAILTRVATVTA